MRNAVIVSVVAFASGAFAANSTYIPSGISSGCSSFLTQLDQDTTLNTCLTHLTTATAAFAGSNPSSSNIGSTLSSLCADDGSCSNTATRGSLASFWGACTAELSGSSANSDVQLLYDLLYDFTPMRAAICTKDSSTQNYCVAGLASTTPATKRTINKRDAPTVNAGALASSGAPFLYMLPSSSSAQLCTPCGKAVLQSYVTWEAPMPYAFGLKQSPIIGGQAALWSAVEQTCGTSFLDVITADAGAAPLAALAGGASALVQKPLAALVGVAGLVAVLLM